MTDTTFAQQKVQLEQELTRFVDSSWRQFRTNSVINTAIIVLALLCSFGVTLFGIGENGVFAALLGALIALLIALGQAFDFGGKADFYRVVHAESDNLLTRLHILTDDARELQQILQQFVVLRKYAAEKLPRGKGMEAISSMTKEMTITY